MDCQWSIIAQKNGTIPGTRADSIDIVDFNTFIKASAPYNFYIIIKIKDKESSTIKACNSIVKDKRFED